jgi:type II secretory pathway component PulM
VASKLGARLEDLKGSLERLSPRERVMLGGLAATFVIGVIVVVGYIIVSGLEELEEKNSATRQALKDLAENRACFLAHRQRTAQIEVRMSRTPLELNRFVETAASAVGVSIAESSEVSPVDIDRYTQRGVEIKLRKVKIEELAKLMKELENSPHIVQITRLNVSTRWNEHSELDVEMVVSTFERRKKPAGGDEPTRVRRKRGRS